MAISVFDLFKVGIGPSSSHTVGPMRAARMFVVQIQQRDLMPRLARLRCSLHGSLGATGLGHASDKAVLLGWMGHTPDTVEVAKIPSWVEEVRQQEALMVLGEIEGPRLAQARGMDALFVLREGEHFKEISIVGGQLQAQIETRPM